MKITKDMLHPDLQGSYGAVRVMTWLMKRRWFRALSNWLAKVGLAGKNIKGLHCEERFIDSSDGHWKIRVRIYRPSGEQQQLPAMLYIHGGGYILGNPESAHAIIEEFITTRPCVVIAPDYRKAGTQPYPAGFNDCYETLMWAQQHADSLNITGDRWMVAGHSAGGGLTAAVTLKARDTGDVQLAFQMPIYPMIDDLQPQDTQREIQSPIWDSTLNAIGWGAYLQDLTESDQAIPAYAAPARNNDYTNFPPTITFVGDCEPFYRETVDYVSALRRAGVDVAFKEYKGCFHGFDMFGQGIGEEAKRFTYDQFAAFFDRAYPSAEEEPAHV